MERRFKDKLNKVLGIILPTNPRDALDFAYWMTSLGRFYETKRPVPKYVKLVQEQRRLAAKNRSGR